MDSLLNSAIGPVGSNAAGMAAGLGLLGLAALTWRLPKLRGTTLLAPWFWSVVALSTVTTSEVLIAWSDGPIADWVAPLRFVAAVSTLCPAMALLGAKRPQNRGWQLIVVSLWAILSLPGIEWLLFGGPREIHPARFWFLLILVGASALNGVGTRFWPSSLLFAAGQLALTAPFLFDRTALFGVGASLWGTAALVLAWLLVSARVPRCRAAERPLDRVWLDFRDAFGVVWALRVMERINASARMYEWPVTLTWHGFAAVDDAPTRDVPQAVEDSLRTLLRRFVSRDWIDDRLGKRADDPARVNDPVASLES